MSLLHKAGDAHQPYQHERLGILVAISKEGQKTIKKFRKQYKGKQAVPEDEVPGFPFVMDESAESLRIDFEHPGTYKIKELTNAD